MRISREEAHLREQGDATWPRAGGSSGGVHPSRLARPRPLRLCGRCCPGGYGTKRGHRSRERVFRCDTWLGPSYEGNQSGRCEPARLRCRSSTGGSQGEAHRQTRERFGHVALHDWARSKRRLRTSTPPNVAARRAGSSIGGCGNESACAGRFHHAELSRFRNSIPRP